MPNKPKLVQRGFKYAERLRQALKAAKKEYKNANR